MKRNTEPLIAMNKDLDELEDKYELELSKIQFRQMVEENKVLCAENNRLREKVKTLQFNLLETNKELGVLEMMQCKCNKNV